MVRLFCVAFAAAIVVALVVGCGGGGGGEVATGNVEGWVYVATGGRQTDYVEISDSSTPPAGHEPAVGATVELEGTSFSTTTNSAGFYQFRDVPDNQYTLVVTVSGHAPKRVPIRVLRTCTTSGANSPFAGNWTGTFSGGDSGSFTATVDKEGNITGSGTSNLAGPFTMQGSANLQGQVQVSISLGSIAWTGAMGVDSGSGQWAAPAGGPSGTWTATKAGSPGRTCNFTAELVSYTVQ